MHGFQLSTRINPSFYLPFFSNSQIFPSSFQILLSRCSFRLNRTGEELLLASFRMRNELLTAFVVSLFASAISYPIYQFILNDSKTGMVLEVHQISYAYSLRVYECDTNLLKLFFSIHKWRVKLLKIRYIHSITILDIAIALKIKSLSMLLCTQKTTALVHSCFRKNGCANMLTVMFEVDIV